MTTKNDVVLEIFGLVLEHDLQKLRVLTRELSRYRDQPGIEKSRFEGTKRRGIPGFSGRLLPRWRSVVVTGGTGCVGRVVLGRLVKDLPNARLSSISRHAPTADRRVAGVTYALGDVRNPVRVGQLLKAERPDLLVHLAAQRDPSYAEDHVFETVSTNIVGSSVVLKAASEAGADTVVVASTGKAVRLFTSDVYAATKKLVEYQAAVAARRYEMKVACARFTHVVDNSIFGMRLVDWIAKGQPIRLHSPDSMLPVQSALECYHLLTTAARVAELAPKGVALRDLGWPPVDLLDMTLDYLDETPNSLSPIIFTGHPSGYEEFAYPGTYDPLTAGEVSPLINCQEALRTAPSDILGNYIDQWRLKTEQSSAVDHDLAVLIHACHNATSDLEIRRHLRATSVSLLSLLIQSGSPEQLTRIHRLGRHHNTTIADHRLIHAQLSAYLDDAEVGKKSTYASS